jgi:hypothetical protein
MSWLSKFLDHLRGGTSLPKIAADLQLVLGLLTALEPEAPASLKPRIAQGEAILKGLIRDLTVFEILGHL